jgi:hypothetical protein
MIANTARVGMNFRESSLCNVHLLVQPMREFGADALPLIVGVYLPLIQITGDSAPVIFLYKDPPQSQSQGQAQDRVQLWGSESETMATSNIKILRYVVKNGTLRTRQRYCPATGHLLDIPLTKKFPPPLSEDCNSFQGLPVQVMHAYLPLSNVDCMAPVQQQLPAARHMEFGACSPLVRTPEFLIRELNGTTVHTGYLRDPRMRARMYNIGRYEPLSPRAVLPFFLSKYQDSPF